jgi:prepilin-type processing-associated H-X9-DG protein
MWGMDGRNQNQPATESQVRYPSSTVAIGEWGKVDYTGCMWVGPPSFYSQYTLKPLEKNGDRRHNGGSNYVFFDGHAGWLRPEVTVYNVTCCVEKQMKPSNGATDVLYYGDGVHPGWGR